MQSFIILSHDDVLLSYFAVNTLAIKEWKSFFKSEKRFIFVIR